MRWRWRCKWVDTPPRYCFPVFKMRIGATVIQVDSTAFMANGYKHEALKSWKTTRSTEFRKWLFCEHYVLVPATKSSLMSE